MKHLFMSAAVALILASCGSPNAPEAPAGAAAPAAGAAPAPSVTNAEMEYKNALMTFAGTYTGTTPWSGKDNETVTLSLKDDGTCTVNAGGKESTGRWKSDGKRLIVAEGGQSSHSFFVDKAGILTPSTPDGSTVECGGCKLTREGASATPQKGQGQAQPASGSGLVKPGAN